jgi:hypothetical protein
MNLLVSLAVWALLGALFGLAWTLGTAAAR